MLAYILIWNQFTFPYSPTTQFPHPLANIKMRKSNVDENYVNFMSYSLVELLTWQGLGDIVNRFRENTLRLEPVSSLWAPGALYRMKVPYTYLWSPSLVPKPRDWGPEIDIGGFVFLDLASKFQPSKELSDFLAAGEPPVYIGFGSIVVDDPGQIHRYDLQSGGDGWCASSCEQRLGRLRPRQREHSSEHLHAR